MGRRLTYTRNQVTITTTAAPLPVKNVGDVYLGGKVIYTWSGGTYGLIALSGGTLVSSPWGCSGTNITTGTGIGNGLQNTLNIIAGCTTAGIAARTATGCTIGGSGWFLPSTDELQKCYDQRAILNIGVNNMWTSSQLNTTTANRLNPNNGGFAADTKDSSLVVLPCKYFP